MSDTHQTSPRSGRLTDAPVGNPSANRLGHVFSPSHGVSVRVALRRIPVANANACCATPAPPTPAPPTARRR